MLTVFATPKPFCGHIGVIQRNAIVSWLRLDPGVEVILFGDEDGTAEICRELGLRHVPEVERSAEGLKYVRPIFDRAQHLARHHLLCYSNCDMILMSDFRLAIEKVAAWSKQFLMVGRRWDTEVTAPLDFDQPGWQQTLTNLASSTGFQRLYYNIDYFAFRRGLFRDIPPLTIGRVYWDHWLVWAARARKAPVVDASEVVCAVHQNHDYSYHSQGQQGVWYDAAAQRNFAVTGGRRHLRTIEDATHRMTARGIAPNRLYWLAPTKRLMRRVMAAIRRFVRVGLWHPLLDATRSLRHALGLRRENVALSLGRRRAVRRHWLDQ